MPEERPPVAQEHFMKPTMEGEKAPAPKTVRDTVRVSARDRVVLQLQYRRQDGLQVTRWVEPYSYRTEKGQEFLYAWCRTHREIHKFNTRGLLAASLTKARVPFSNPRGITVEIS